MTTTSREYRTTSRAVRRVLATRVAGGWVILDRGRDLRIVERLDERDDGEAQAAAIADDYAEQAGLAGRPLVRRIRGRSQEAHAA